MMRLSCSELLLGAGAVLMAAAVVGAIVCAAVFTLAGRRLRERLEQEYGEPWN